MPLFSFAIKALRVGPLPYIALSVMVIGVGAFLQYRSGTTQNLAGGGTLFGVFAQIGGCIGLFGLLTLIFNGLPAEPGAEAHGADVPASARAARLDAANPRKARPGPALNGRPVGASAQPAAQPAPRSALQSAVPKASVLASPAAKAGMRLARQMGTQALRGLARRG